MLQQPAIVIFKKLYIRLEHSIRVQKLPSMTFATSSLVHQCDIPLVACIEFQNIEQRFYFRYNAPSVVGTLSLTNTLLTLTIQF